jgi:hypothetical protein
MIVMIYLYIIDCNQNFVYSNNINTMNALLLPDLIQSILSWYLWKNKISLLNKQYHEVFECFDNLDDDNCHDPDDGILLLKYFSSNDTSCYIFNWRMRWKSRLTITSYRFDKVENNYVRSSDDYNIPKNYF